MELPALHAATKLFAHYMELLAYLTGALHNTQNFLHATWSSLHTTQLFAHYMELLAYLTGALYNT